MNPIEISLFPIPGTVSLPFSKVSLHVFEPRYRKMIKDSIDANRRIGIAHTQKVISESKVDPSAPLEDKLSQNQATYQPYPIFSAGFAKILETLPDGRLMVEINTDCRYEIVEEMQQVPYKIVLCQPFLDESNDIKPEDIKGLNYVDANTLRLQLDEALLELLKGQDQNLTQYLQSSSWVDQTLEEYSYKIYTIVSFEPDVLQKVLELRSSFERISFLKDILTRPPLQ